MPLEIDLSTYLKNLRRELKETIDEGKDEDLQFRVDEIIMTVEVVATEKKEGTGGLEFWVVNAGGSYSSERSEGQSLSIKMQPLLNGDVVPLLE